MAKKLIDTSTLTSIADAIREKEESEDNILVSDFAERILELSGDTDVLFSLEEYCPESTVSIGSNNTFYHYLGVEPTFIIILNKKTFKQSIAQHSSSTYYSLLICFIDNRAEWFRYISRETAGTSTTPSATGYYSGSTAGKNYESDEEKTVFTSGMNSTKFIANETYYVIQIAFEYPN